MVLNHTTDSEHRVSSEESRGRKTKGERAEEVLRENVVGSTLSGRDGVTVVAQDGSITATASALHSEQGAVALQAKQDVILNTATERESTFSEERSQKKGFLKKSSSHSIANDATTREKGSLLSGDSISVNAGNDLTVSGSAIAADRDVNLQAGNNVDIGAATETDTHYRLKEKKKSGLLGSGGIGFTIGKQSSKHEIDEKGRTQSQSVSTVGSSQGSANITAGNQLHIGGADLVAGKDLALTGDSVTIDPGYDQRTRKETFEQKQSGLSVALSGAVGGALNTAVSSAQQARKEGDGRLNALQNTKAALSGVQAAQAWERDNALTASAEAKNAAAGLQPGDEGAAQGATNTVGISASYGSQSSKSETRTDSRQSQGSTLTAGQNLSITATGKNHNAQSGDITITGSQLKAGKDLSLDAARDNTLQSVQNSESTVGKNSSKGGNVGVGIGAGSGGYGISVSAGVNAGKGHENGNGLTHTETTLDAGSNLKVTSGRDTRLTGAQASGEKVTVDVGRDLRLESEQDSDRYDAKQQNASAGGSFTFGSMTGSANVSASKDKLHSNFDSVKEQTGLFAGQGGYDVKVKEHTQLNGAVIASTADKENNRLDTGTLGWADIHNQADYSATHSGGSFSTGGPVGKDLLTNMAGGMLSGANNSGHAEGTTKAGVSEGTLIVRDKDKQQQDVAQLNRDTEHANDGSISPIFNKEKEQNRLKQAQLIGEIGGQAMDVIRTQGDIAGLKAQKDPAALAQAREQLEKSGKPASDAAVMQRAYDNAMRQYGTGSDLQKAAQAVTGALTALAGNNLAGALASGASPYLATEIKKLTTNPLTGEVDVAANTMAHAILGAVTAQLNNQSAAAGGLGAGGGELAARYIAGQLFPGKTAEQLSESEKQKVSALSQLAAGLAGGLATGDTAGAVTGGQAGKNAVENNSLAGDKARESVKQSAEWWKAQVRDKLGENLASQLVNGLIHAGSEAGDTVMLGGDTAFDLTAALASCATGSSYCNQARSDLAKKDASAAATLTAIINGDTWEGIKSTTIKAANGDQKALENVAGVLSGALVSAKVLPSGGNAIKSDSAAVNAGKATSGAENAATYPKLKDELRQQNLNNIAKLDPRLSEAVKGSGTTNPNFSIGMGTAAEADRLGKLWVGDGGKLVDNQKKCPGCWASADGSLIYRPPSPKKSPFATTGVQANFQILDKSGVVISNGHLNVTK
ncbi:Filamentous hemagglutinin [Serratia marcescens]|nr:hemagglutinin repeat-containing protein [Serratia marcescens]CVB09094.1 Filamentous hemagglutinin [Serratia marcescens]